MIAPTTDPTWRRPRYRWVVVALCAISAAALFWSYAGAMAGGPDMLTPSMRIMTIVLVGVITAQVASIVLHLGGWPEQPLRSAHRMSPLFYILIALLLLAAIVTSMVGVLTGESRTIALPALAFSLGVVRLGWQFVRERSGQPFAPAADEPEGG